MTLIGQAGAGSSDPDRVTPLAAADIDRLEGVDQRDIGFWRSHLVMGFFILVAEALASVVYVVTTDGPHRSVLTAIAVATAAVGLAGVGVSPWVASQRWRAPFVLAWSLLSVALLAICASLDSGLESPFLFLAVLPAMYSTLLLSPRAVTACGLGTAAAVVVVGVTDQDMELPQQNLLMFVAAVGGVVVLAVAAAIYRSRSDTRQAELVAGLRHAAVTDALTGCPNQRVFEWQLAAEIDRFVRYHVPFSLAIIDVDMLKAFNDTFGHVAGDEALASLGATLRSQCRPSDVVARIGGDEFALILPATGLAEAMDAVRRVAGEVNENSSGLTVSIGVAQVRASDPTSRSLYRDADAALYTAKVSGRATVSAVGDDAALGATSPAGSGHSSTRAADLLVMERRVAQAEREKNELVVQQQGLTDEYLRGFLASLPQLIWTCAVDGPCDYLSPQWISYTGIPASEQLGYGWLEQVHPEDRAATIATWQASVTTGEPFDMPLRIRRRDGEYRWFVTRASPLRDSDGRIIRWIGSNTDVEAQKQAEQRLARNFTAMVHTMARTVEARDPYTAGHQQRVALIATAIATDLGLESSRVEGVWTGASVHDIGKVAIPAEILTKPGKLLPPEFELIKRHPELGHELVAGLDFPWPVANIILEHHERLDGSGYPRGLHGEEISLEARIVAVADVVEAMAAHRPYRPAHGVEVALEFIISEADRTLDGAAVRTCVELVRSGQVHVGLSRPDDPVEARRETTSAPVR